MKKAEITAFLSLVFILMVSFVLGILEVSVIHTTKNLNRLAADRAAFSVFGEYHRKLLEDYHVFAIEGSYGTGEYSDERLIGRMHYYGTAGMEQEITGIQYLTDLNGQAFREQVRYFSIWRRDMGFHSSAILPALLPGGRSRQYREKKWKKQKETSSMK